MKLDLPKVKLPNIKEMTYADWKRFAKEHEKQIYMVLFILAAIVVAISFGIKSIAVIIGLILFGALSSVFIAYSGLHFGNDFTLFSTIVGAYLFGPWVGVLIVLGEYLLISRFPQEDIDYPVGFWYALVVLFIMPKIPFDIPILQLLAASAIGEVGNGFYWLMKGFPPPSVLISAVLKMIWYLFFFVYVVPGIATFLM